MPDSTIALAFIGTLIPDQPRYYGPAFNRAGQMFQKELVHGLSRAGLPPAAVYSVEPTEAFPRGRQLLVGKGRIVRVDGLTVILLPYVNIQPLKPITAGLSVLVALLLWGWRHRRQRRLVHCVNLTMPPAAFVLFAARLIRAKVSVSVLDVAEPGEFVPNRFFTRVDFWMQRHAIKYFDGHMVAAQAIGDDFVPGRAVCRIEGGIVPSDFADPVAERFAPLDGESFRVVLSGTLGAYNGVRLALDAFQQLPDGFELVIVGTGPLDDEIRTRAKLDPKVVFKGFMGFAQVLELYQTADLLLNIRLTRSINTRHFYPSKMMEFLTSGRPTLSTCTGHTEEEFGEFVYLLREETPEALAALIKRIAAADPAERAHMGRRAREYMFANKTWNRQGERLLLYLRRHVFGDAV